MPTTGADHSVRIEADARYSEGRFAEALVLYSRLIESAREDASLLARCGTCLLQLGEWQRAMSLFDAALSRQPRLAEAVRGQAILHAHQGRFEQALEAFLRLAELEPDKAINLHNIGIALNRLRRFEQAVGWFERALAMAPGFADAWTGLAAARDELVETDAARAAIDRAIAANPKAALPRLMRTMLSLPTIAESPAVSAGAADDFSRALAALSDGASAAPDQLMALGEHVGDRQPFLLAYRPGNHRELLSRYGELMARAARTYWQSRGLLPLAKPPERPRVRLAILCAQIRRHSVWDVIVKGLVRHLLRTRFELILYHTGSETDAETQWAERHAERFVGGPRGHAEWLSIIRADAPDVLFLPEVGMDPLACKLGALRLAPLQVASWGHPMTTGLPEIDLFFSGALLEPPGAAEHYRERLVCLPGTGVCTDKPESAPLALPAGYLRPRVPKRLRLLLCQHPFKFDPSDMPLIAEVVRACAPCELYVLKHRRLVRAAELAVGLLRQAMTDAGLDADAVLVERPWVDRGAFMCLLNEMDLYLDLPAFSGYTTAWQALHAGLPVVTMEGGMLRQRLAAGLLRQIGMRDLIARDADGYCAVAARLAAEARGIKTRAARRAELQAAAARADHQVEAVRAFERRLLEMFETNEAAANHGHCAAGV